MKHRPSFDVAFWLALAVFMILMAAFAGGYASDVVNTILGGLTQTLPTLIRP